MKEPTPYDVASLFAQGKSYQAAAKELQRKGFKVNRQTIPTLLHRAFQEGIVCLQGDSINQDLMIQLRAKFPAVDSCVIEADHEFPRLAAVQILEWTREWLEDHRSEEFTPYVAIGGGKTMNRVARDVGTILATPERMLLSEYYDGKNMVFVNATAGGLARKPTLESSHVACDFGQNVFGQNEEQKVNIFSLSTNPSPDEQYVEENAVNNTRILISGVGDRDAYCAHTMAQKDILENKSDLDRIEAEYLFHCFDSEGRSIRVRPERFEIKETTVKSGGKKRAKSPVLATLMGFDSLRSEKLCRVAVAHGATKGTHEERNRKAAAIYVLARNLYLTHLCVSADLAREILKLKR